MRRCSWFALSILILLSAAAQARVISYAPYTDRNAIPVMQERLNRHFVLIEQVSSPSSGPIPSPPLPVSSQAQLVLYDSKGLEEPRVIYPQDGSYATINIAAAREEANVVSILIQTFTSSNSPIWSMTTDSGATWKSVDLPKTAVFQQQFADNGGRFARGKYSLIRAGTSDVPFVLALHGPDALYAVTSSGTVKKLYSPATGTINLAGSDREGRRFLLWESAGIEIIDVDGNRTAVSTAHLSGLVEGWITSYGRVYLEHWQNPGQVVLWKAEGGSLDPVAASWDGPANVQPPINSSWFFFAVPRYDYEGAWIIRGGGGRPTQLMHHLPCFCLISPPPAELGTMWEDVSAPQVEALIPSQTGHKVLIQVHRPRQSVDNLMFKDPAIAVWNFGDPAPKFYDELFLSETSTKGFVHVDVDAVESGDPFVFDSGASQAFFPPTLISPSLPGGGSDVVQEWGVVRASLKQQLVLPGVGHTVGAFDSVWATDVTFYNPSDSELGILLAFVPSNAPVPPCATLGPLGCSRQLTLAAHEIRLVADIAKSMFGVTNGTGALYIGEGVNVTARTYNTTSTGTYGFTMNGIDVFSAVGPRFPVTFAAAFEGLNFRTNLVLTDVSGRGTSVAASSAGPDGSRISEAVTFDTFESGENQFNFIGPMLGMGGSDTGALVLQPTRGETIASLFVVDNRTNDPTFFPPDIPASVMRVIPAIGHLDGANGSKFRSDLYLFNNSSLAKTLTLQAKLWDVPENPSTLPLTLLPHEARVIHDVLLTAFNKTGIARLRFTLQGPITDTSVRVTSRTYTVNPDGGTCGFQMPPLNSFQSGSPGDTLEILGASLDSRFRTNLGLVDLTAFPGSVTARAHIDIIDDTGRTLDSFDRDVPSAGGVQINDLFHARSLPDTGKPVLIRVTTIQGLIGAYAAFVDNGTNDPAYVAANLAAK
jgi:hypothetical protein